MPNEGRESAAGTVFVVDDDPDVRHALRWLLESVRLEVRAFPSIAEFLDAHGPGTEGCLVLDVRMPGMSGMELLERLDALGIELPVIMLSGHGTIPMATRAMRLGAVDFVQKPVNEQLLLERIHEALERSRRTRSRKAATLKLAALTPREREVVNLVAAGKHNKDIAKVLGLSARTVEAHRAHAMRKLDIGSVAELVALLEASSPAHRP